MDRTDEGFKPHDPLSHVPVLAWGMDGVCKACSISRSTLERLRSGGNFPPPDRMVGRKPLWLIDTVRAWLDGPGEKGGTR